MPMFGFEAAAKEDGAVDFAAAGGAAAGVATGAFACTAGAAAGAVAGFSVASLLVSAASPCVAFCCPQSRHWVTLNACGMN